MGLIALLAGRELTMGKLGLGVLSVLNQRSPLTE
jgi:hypothetical protein